LEARAYYIDSAGRVVGIEAEWIPAETKLVTVSPGKSHQVTITIQGAGETSLFVKTSQRSKTLYIKATVQNDGIQMVEIRE
jgi:VCBS repeat-containing protein